MAQPHFEMVTESVESIRFSFYTDDEVRNMSFKKITNPVLFDNLRKPTEGGLYDPALGPIDFNESCKSCGEPSVHCPGHCGHIDLVLPVYNPLLFGTLHKLLKRICFSCHHFMMNSERIQNYVSKLELIKKGDIVRAKSESYMAIEEKKSESDIPFMNADTMACSTSQDFEQPSWTSLQYHEARSIFDEVMLENFKKCENCESSSSKIKSPSFGRLYMDALASSKIRANVIRGSKLDNITTLGGVRPFIDEKMMQPAEDISSFGNVIDPSGAELSGSIADGEGRIADLSHKNPDEHLPPEFLTQKMLSKQTYLTPLQVKYHLRLLWENEPRFCSLVSDIQQESLGVSGKNESYSCFFIQALLVPPSKFRAPSKGGNNAAVLEHPQNVLLGKVLQNNLSLGDAITTLSVDSERLRVIQTLYKWMNLQESVNVLVDSSKATDNKDKGSSGICQLLEKKEGIFRQKMMGKRVNFSCRSVISPDPYLAVNEIGIPPYFAERLTYPEKVTPWNVDKLRHAIINGPEIHPGATHYADKMGMTKLPFLKNKRISIAKKLPTSRGVVSHPGKILDSEFEGKVVYRHLQDGDIVLVNRQPTLHKPSMMAHVVRVLKGEKTLRMHYANCSTYNADFDGDEMNVHFPQDEIARAEALYIVNANEQYIVPTSGNPTRGLIQDHIVSAVLITMKNTFLTKEEYHQLLYTALVSTIAPDPRPGKCGKKVCSIKSDAEFQALPPAILRPKQLWTGKQVITTILNHIARGQPPFTMKIMGKVPIETEVLIQKNELLQGIVDKAQFAKYGLVHTVQELYGANTAGFLLSVFSRLFTGFLQMHGFTCGVDDLLITQEAELERKKKLEKSEMIGESVHSKFVGAEDGSFDPVKLQMEIEKILRSKGESASLYLDRKMSSELNRLTSEVNDIIFNGERNQTGALFQGGLLKRFPYNCLSLMTTTGAKGSQVNFQQISSLLGQQDLEGKRVPRMVSGKTLPCFPPWDWASRAGGFISDRYLTGLRPQEYYFHCMAGRDGLVDTAIKTSRSGYLQRCLIKNLECLKVCYDYTVRDADGSVVQFCYGEDGVDVLRTSCLSEFLILANNQKIILERLAAGQPKDADIFDSNSYMKELPDALVRKANEFIDGLSKKNRDSLNLRKRKHFMKLMKLKYLSSLAQPGEPVGVIAAQSIGEPSTQMTLNTFHFAGRGEMNVTLGIPRLKEILTLASKKILTPVMTCPLLWGRTRDDAQHLAAKLLRVRLADLVESIEVYVVPFSLEKQEITTTYKLKLKLYPPELYPPYSNITEEECEEALKSMFFPQFVKMLETYVKKLSRETDGITATSENLMHDFTKQTGDDDSGNKYSQSAEGNGDDDKDDDEDEEDQGFDALKRKRQVNDDMDYEDEGSGLEDGEKEHVGFYREADQFDDGDYDTKEDQSRLFDAEVEVSKSSMKQEIISKSKPSSKAAKLEAKEKMAKSKPSKKQKKSRGLLKATILNARGTNFEAQFRFWEGTHILLSQMAEKLAKRIYIRSTNSIDQCSVIDWSSSSNSKEKPKIPALQTAGVNFQAIWELGDDLDFRNLHSNHINAMLETYGVEAARATIISEVKNVFQLYGITVDSRHLSLVADFMTYNGGYRPMNRFGIVQSTSPLHKTTFETATKFLVEAAYHREVENLESASARIILGMPVKMGTGYFDVLQDLEV